VNLTHVSMVVYAPTVMMEYLNVNVHMALKDCIVKVYSYFFDI
jgi:hypothetical protein